MFESVAHYFAQESSMRSHQRDGTFCSSAFDTSACSGDFRYGSYDDDGSDDDDDGAEQIIYAPTPLSVGSDWLSQALVRSPSDESISSASTDGSADASLSGFSWANDAEDEFGLDVGRPSTGACEIAVACIIAPIMPLGRSPLAVIYEVSDDEADDEDELMAASDDDDGADDGEDDEDEDDEDDESADWLDGMTTEKLDEIAWAYQPKRSKQPLIQSRPAGYRHRYRRSRDGSSPPRMTLVFVDAWRAGERATPVGPSRLRYSFTDDE